MNIKEIVDKIKYKYRELKHKMTPVSPLRAKKGHGKHCQLYWDPYHGDPGAFLANGTDGHHTYYALIPEPGLGGNPNFQLKRCFYNNPTLYSTYKTHIMVRGVDGGVTRNYWVQWGGHNHPSGGSWSVTKGATYAFLQTSVPTGSPTYAYAYIFPKFDKTWLAGKKIQIDWEGHINAGVVGVSEIYTKAGIFRGNSEMLLGKQAGGVSGPPSVVWSRETITADLPDISSWLDPVRLNIQIHSNTNGAFISYGEIKVYNFAILDSSSNVVFHINFSVGEPMNPTGSPSQYHWI